MSQEHIQKFTEILSNQFGMEKIKIKSYLREERPEKVEAALKNLEYLMEHAPLALTEEETKIFTSPALSCSYDELLFAAQVPDMLSFTEEQRIRYEKQAFYWSLYKDIRDPIEPLLSQICGEELAHTILCEIYINSYIKVHARGIEVICRRLLAYPDPTGVLPKYMKEWWHSLFSVYSDPIAALDKLEEFFVPEHMIEIFADGTDWPRLGYALGYKPTSLIKKRSDVDAIIEQTKVKYPQYLK